MAVATNEFGLFINGETVEGSSSRDLTEPASGESLGTAQLAGEAEIDRAVAAARGALDGDWGKTPANERSRLLHALADAVKANRNELVRARGAQRRQGDLLDQGGLFGAVENFRVPLPLTFASASLRSAAARTRSAARSSRTR